MRIHGLGPESRAYRRQVSRFRTFKVKLVRFLATLSWVELEELREMIDEALAPHEERMDEARSAAIAEEVFAPFGEPAE